MEVGATITGWTHRAIPFDDPSRVGEARRHAAQLATDLGWSETDAGRLALVVTELGTNLQRHARNGRLLIAARPGTAEVELISIDEGPGIADIARAMQDGHSTGGTPGTGLGAVQRLSDDFEIHSVVGEGTVSVARVRAASARAAASALCIGAICLPAPYESVSGDGWAIAETDGQATLLMADGLGHGPDAAHASNAAVAAFGTAPDEDLREILKRVHEKLRPTRGAAVGALRLEAEAGVVTHVGAGNIVGRVLSGTHDKSIITQPGTAGLQIRKPETAALEWPPHALVVLHSDGIETRWGVERLRPVLQREPTLVAAVLLRDHTRHRDDATIVVVRRKE